MGQVDANALQGRDAAIWGEYCSGIRQSDIAEKHGVAQSTISEAIRRYAAAIPEEEKRVYRERTMERYERLYLAHARAGEEWPRVAAIVRGILDSEARVLGLVQSQVQVQGEVHHLAEEVEHGPTVEQLLEKWRAEGALKGVLTRPDDGPGE